MFRITRATPYVTGTSISFFGVCGHNKLIKFKDANFVFADGLLYVSSLEPLLAASSDSRLISKTYLKL